MPQYTVRFAHLEKMPPYAIGSVIRRGDVVGFMGNTGKSTAAHLHLDVVLGVQPPRYSLADMERGLPAPAPRQAALFVDRELFGIEPIITSYYADPEYLELFGKLHTGFDVVPADRHRTREHFGIRWNRSMDGRVTAKENDPGYGIVVYITYETLA